jgi:hypothetical protein
MAALTHLCNVVVWLACRNVLLFRRAVGGTIVAPVLVRLWMDTLGLFVGLPEILLATGKSLHPWWEEATRNAVCPILFLFFVVRHNASTRSLLDEPDGGVDDDVRADTGNQTVGNRVSERHNRNREEGGDSITHVAPVNIFGRLGHQRANNDQCASSGPRWNRSEDWRKEYGDEEANTSEHGGKTSLATLGNSGSGLDEGGDWGRTHEGSDRNTDGVDTVGDGRVLEVLSALIDGAGETSHGVQGTGT